MCEEYAHIEKFLNSYPALRKRHIGSFLAKKYHNYLYTYKRIGNTHKQDFLERFSNEFRKSKHSGDLKKASLSKADMMMLERIMADHVKFYYDDTIWELNHEIKALSEIRLSVLEEAEG